MQIHPLASLREWIEPTIALVIAVGAIWKWLVMPIHKEIAESKAAGLKEAENLRKELESSFAEWKKDSFDIRTIITSEMGKSVKMEYTLDKLREMLTRVETQQKQQSRQNQRMFEKLSAIESRLSSVETTLEYIQNGRGK